MQNILSRCSGLSLLVLAFGLAGLTACGGRVAQTPEIAAACSALAPANPALERLIEPEGLDQWLFDEAVRHAVNAERCSRGLVPLQEESALARAASLHGGDMVVHDFFDHTSPVSGRTTLGERYAHTGVQYSRAAENLATISLYDFGGKHFNRRNLAACDFTFTEGGRSIARQTYSGAARALIDGWMDSPGHRRNILHPGMRRHGAGVAFKPDPEICGMLVVVQDFAG
ncbi:MAG TPA: CAP domain-containing protein [Thermohalobaculum sp.]|nr:CAP domain-containing protein [Thermohalobaculum sp.]